MGTEPIALVDARLVDGTGAAPLEGATAMVEDGLVVEVGANVHVPSHCRVFDVEGRTVLPGLVDGHMHVTGMPGLLDSRAMLEAQLEASEILRECPSVGDSGRGSGLSARLPALPGRARRRAGTSPRGG